MYYVLFSISLFYYFHELFYFYFIIPTISVLYKLMYKYIINVSKEAEVLLILLKSVPDY